MLRIENISFDEQDQNLFRVRDVRLRADALQHSLLPRLQIVLNEACTRIKRIYDIEALEDSTISYFPHFRRKRERDLEHVYDHAFIGLGGRRTKGRWHGIARRDGKPVQIVPFRFAFVLSEGGMSLILENNWLKGLTTDSYRQFLGFVIDHADLILPLCVHTGMEPVRPYDEAVRPLAPLRDHYRLMMDIGYHDNHFVSHELRYPIHSDQLKEFVYDFALFFPVYDSYLRIAKGEPVRFNQLIEKANDWLETRINSNDDEPARSEEATIVGSESSELAVAEAASQRVPVMPSIRWLVFQRDDWRCVACGRGSHDGIILQVDHILPRSRGGPDTIENYQTLCDLCNSGKGNRDTTDLRRSTL